MDPLRGSRLEEGPGGGRVGLEARMEGRGLAREAADAGRLADGLGPDGPQIAPVHSLTRSVKRGRRFC